MWECLDILHLFVFLNYTLKVSLLIGVNCKLISCFILVHNRNIIVSGRYDLMENWDYLFSNFEISPPFTASGRAFLSIVWHSSYRNKYIISYRIFLSFFSFSSKFCFLFSSLIQKTIELIITFFCFNFIRGKIKYHQTSTAYVLIGCFYNLNNYPKSYLEHVKNGEQLVAGERY